MKTRLDKFEKWVVDQGGHAATARLLGTSTGLIGQWIRRDTRVTAERALQIVGESNGALQPEDLCEAQWDRLRRAWGVPPVV